MLIGYQSNEKLQPIYFRLLQRIFAKADRKLKLELIERGVTMLAYEALTHSDVKTRKEAIGLLYECFSEDCVDFLTHME